MGFHDVTHVSHVNDIKCSQYESFKGVTCEIFRIIPTYLGVRKPGREGKERLMDGQPSNHPTTWLERSFSLLYCATLPPFLPESLLTPFLCLPACLPPRLGLRRRILGPSVRPFTAWKRFFKLSPSSLVRTRPRCLSVKLERHLQLSTCCFYSNNRAVYKLYYCVI